MTNEVISALILAIVQGVTEWLPISSSGHLVLIESILGFQKGGLAFDVALHFGTLMAVFVYFGKDICDILQDLLLGRFRSEHGRMGILLIVATIPAAIVGYFASGFFESTLSSLIVVAMGFGITGLFLLIAALYKIPDKARNIKDFGYGSAFLVGVAQAISIVPGVSRSGATMSSSLLFGLNEKNAMKFAFLMSIPVIFGANILAIGSEALPTELVWASLISFVVGLATIHVLFKYILIHRKNLLWFAVYCLILAVSLGIWLVLG